VYSTGEVLKALGTTCGLADRTVQQAMRVGWKRPNHTEEAVIRDVYYMRQAKFFFFFFVRYEGDWSSTRIGDWSSVQIPLSERFIARIPCYQTGVSSNDAPCCQMSNCWFDCRAFVGCML
jgi:hypothetical protein